MTQPPTLTLDLLLGSVRRGALDMAREAELTRSWLFLADGRAIAQYAIANVSGPVLIRYVRHKIAEEPMHVQHAILVFETVQQSFAGALDLLYLVVDSNAGFTMSERYKIETAEEGGRTITRWEGSGTAAVAAQFLPMIPRPKRSPN